MTGRDEESELELLSQWRDGDARAGGVLAERYRSKVFRYVRSKVGSDAEVAEDITQKVFMTVVGKRDDIVSHFGRYVRGVARIAVWEHQKKSSKGNAVDARLSQLANSDHGPLSILANGERACRLVQALRSLCVAEQVYLMWYYGDRLTQPQIAERVGLTVGQINGRLHRAREKVKQRVQALEDEGASVSETGFETWMSSVRRGADVLGGAESQGG